MTWSGNCVIIYTNNANQNPTFEITETKLYVPVVTLSTQDNAKLLPQLKSGFKRKISWNKHLAKPELLAQNANLNYLIEPSFQGVNRLFVLAFENDEQRISNKRYYIPNVEFENDEQRTSNKRYYITNVEFENDEQRTSNKRYYIPNVEIKDYNVMIDGKNFFDQPVKNNKVTYENIRKIATGQGDDYTAGCLLDYTYFKNYYKKIVVDLSNQQVLHADPKEIQ